MVTRIDNQFAALKREKRAALITYIMAGDPNYATSLEIMQALPKAGADIIELGMPFSDPMADGPVIQAAAIRALNAGQSLAKTLEMVAAFRKIDQKTPIILMGYYNPIYIHGVKNFVEAAKKVGVDGLLIVDLPPEMDEELCIPALENGLNFIRLATPTTDDKRLPTVLKNTSGFVYYVSMTGITGQSNSDLTRVSEAVTKVKEQSALPIAVGFGIKTAQQAAEVATFADGVVVGTAIVQAIASAVDDADEADPVSAATAIVENLSRALRSF